MLILIDVPLQFTSIFQMWFNGSAQIGKEPIGIDLFHQQELNFQIDLRQHLWEVVTQPIKVGFKVSIHNSSNFVLPKNFKSLVYLSTISGQHPMGMGETVRATACFGRQKNDNWMKFHCRYGKEVLIRNCGDFFIYYLPEVHNCYLRYCSV